MTDLRDSLSCPFTKIKLSLPCIPTSERIFFFYSRLEKTVLPTNNQRDAATKILFLLHQVLTIIHLFLCFPLLYCVKYISLLSLYPVFPVIFPGLDHNCIPCHPSGKIFKQTSLCLTLPFATWEELLVHTQLYLSLSSFSKPLFYWIAWGTKNGKSQATDTVTGLPVTLMCMVFFWCLYLSDVPSLAFRILILCRRDLLLFLLLVSNTVAC